jgi:PhoD related phosphatase
MSTEHLTLGPVLSFRGTHKNTWRVTALVGIKAGESIPTLSVEGKACPVPVVLHQTPQECFVRYDLSCPLRAKERRVAYGFAPNGPQWEFSVPGKGYAPRMTYVSCNGFSDPNDMRKLVRPDNAVWSDLLSNHDRHLRPEDYQLDKEQLWHEQSIHDQGLQRFHLMLMGGDQIYFDAIWEEKTLKYWVSLSRKKQLRYKVTKTLDRQIEQYYFSLYSQRWCPEARKRWLRKEPLRDAADAMATMPTVMMWDDHDIIDGWGSYSSEMQHCEVLQRIFHHARRAFWVFQMQQQLEDLPELILSDRADISQKDPQYAPVNWERVRTRDPLSLPLLDGQPGFTSVYCAGPVAIVAADLRTERSRTQVLGQYSWQALQTWLRDIPEGERNHPGDSCQHLLFMSSVPVVHPKLSLAEELLEVFGNESVVDSSIDDLRDHWSHDDHEGERKRLIETLTKVADSKRLRVSVVSGDVHVAACGGTYRRDLPNINNWAQILQFTSSAVVHPSLVGVPERLFLHLLNRLASRPQKIDPQYEVEMMLFPSHNRYIMPARNWLALELDMGEIGAGCKLWATWRCETQTGFSNHLQAVDPAQ